MSSQTIITGFDPNGPFAGLILPDRFRKRQSETRFKQNWSITLQQYAQMMCERYDMRAKKWVGNKKRQRGSIMMSSSAACTASGGTGGSVFLNTLKLVTSDEVSGDSTAGIRFESDGQLWAIRSAGGDLEYDGEWWTAEPETGIGSSYEVRALASGGSGTWGNAAAADDTWITISANRAWDHTRTTTGSTTVSRTFEVGLDGVESALDSSSISCTASTGL